MWVSEWEEFKDGLRVREIAEQRPPSAKDVICV